jgi:hypothetical protein
MIEFASLAATAVAFLAPLVSKAFEKGAEELGKSTASGIVGKLKAKLAPGPTTEALEDLTQHPADADAQASLRVQLRKAMESDPALAEFMTAWLAESKPQAEAAGIQLTANVQGNHNTVVQMAGSGNSVQL